MIRDRQNNQTAIIYLRSIRVANSVPAFLDFLRAVLAFLFVLGAVMLALLSVSSPVYAGIAAGWAAISSLLLAPYAKRRSIEAASVQELFDRHVFDLPASAKAQRVEPERLHDLSRKFKGSDANLQDWYPVAPALERPFDVLLCQRSNLFYDIRLRARWSYFLLVLVCLWVVVGFAVGVILGVSVGQFLIRWLAPSLPAFVFAVEAVRAQWETVAERETYLARVNDALEGRSETPTAAYGRRLQRIVEEVQDGIFETRCQASRVPNWFYTAFRRRDNDAMYAAAAKYNED